MLYTSKCYTPFAGYICHACSFGNELFCACQPCRDVVTDTVHQFAPAYHDYVLYSDGAHKQAVPPKTVRTRTFVAGKYCFLKCLPRST